MSTSEFFKNRGSLNPDFPSYVERAADNELFQRVLAGQFCYILTCRQMGKTSLIKAHRRTTFNIAYPIELLELERAKVKSIFQTGLKDVCPGQEQIILNKIYDWTQGHPYLTQTLAHAMVERGQNACQAHQVDQLVAEMFLAKKAHLQDDINLQTVKRYISLTENNKRRKLLKLYAKVYHTSGKVREDRNSIDQNQLKVFGLVRTAPDQGILLVKNNIYREVFDLAWIKANTPIDWGRRLAIALAVLVLLLVGLIAYVSSQQEQQSVETQAQITLANFQETSSADVRMTSLANLFQLAGYEGQARRLFFDDAALPPQERIGLFTTVNVQAVEDQLLTVIRGIYKELENNPHHNQFLRGSTPELPNR